MAQRQWRPLPAITPGDMENIISLGPYGPGLLAWIMERKSEDVIWSFSSNPSPNGSEAGLIAPAAMVSSYPSWKESSYYLDQGTSMAAPMVAEPALLLEGMWVKVKHKQPYG